MKLYTCFLGLLCTYTCMAKQPAALKVGDKVPNVIFNSSMHTNKTNLHQFNRKLILIDFWTTTCSSCIHEFLVLDSIQRVYNKSLSILLVSSSMTDTKDRVTKTLTRFQSNTGIALTLPIILQDSIINALFPHTYVPHFAWLDSNFNVIAITGMEEVTPGKIAAVINGQSLSFLATSTQPFDEHRPLFVNGNGGNGSQLRSRSTLAGYIPGLPSSTAISKDSNGLVTQVLLTNQPVLELLKRAYHYFSYPARFQWTAADEQLLNSKNRNGDWLLQHTYCYELISPALPYDSARKLMQQDIRRYFGYSAALKPAATRCYVLRSDSDILQQYRSTGGKKINELANPVSRLIQNRPASEVAEILNQLLPIPVVDETNYSDPIDLQLKAVSFADINALQTALARYGLYLSESVRSIPHLFIYHHPN